MKVFIRRCGFWNARDFALSSQFGHIMICIDEKFYSFTQAQFLKENPYGCVQIISKQEFEKTYQHQHWYEIDFASTAVENAKVIAYFTKTAKDHAYSLRNNCTLECQKALEFGGLVKFPRIYVLPSSVLSFFKKNSLPKLVGIKRVVV